MLDPPRTSHLFRVLRVYQHEGNEARRVSPVKPNAFGSRVKLSMAPEMLAYDSNWRLLALRADARLMLRLLRRTTSWLILVFYGTMVASASWNAAPMDRGDKGCGTCHNGIWGFLRCCPCGLRGPACQAVVGPDPHPTILLTSKSAPVGPDVLSRQSGRQSARFLGLGLPPYVCVLKFNSEELSSQI
ncbi:hypothetical protein B0H17DRAFT_1133946 [Mycena rosella]|uniref:Uncharacterized protein n=1 Tax=Mycena rosella TaxID=1033263 RepID=A0AAD7DGN7_MYCRO|nr:hypothetical protein B0H17DRAFT_1133946 [Mycena rosella]